MIQPLFNGMLAILLAKFVINDLPHAAGILNKALPLRKLFADWGIEVGAEVTMYHFTRKENLEEILMTGLTPKASPGLGRPKGLAVKPGVYLAPTMEDARGLIEDYNLRAERIPGTFSLLEVRLPSEWMVVEDREVLHRYREPPTVISPTPIPSSRLRVVERDFFTVVPVGLEYREVPETYAGMGERVRIQYGEHAGEEGFITLFTGKVEDGFAVWQITLDTGEIVEDRQDRVLALIR